MEVILLEDVRTLGKKGQIVKINDEMLRFYWKLGKDISTMSKQ